MSFYDRQLSVELEGESGGLNAAGCHQVIAVREDEMTFGRMSTR